VAPWGKWPTAKWRSVYLPQKWFEDAARAQEVKLPPGTVYQSKTELALEVIDQALAWELPALPVGADSFYGNDFDFRQALIGIGGAVARSPLPHHRTYGARIRRFRDLSPQGPEVRYAFRRGGFAAPSFLSGFTQSVPG
jgi:SRSO17 transposase